MSGRLPNAPYCPKCGKLCDGWTAIEEGATPDPGSVTVCLTCAAVLQFDEQMELKRMSLSEIKQLPRETRASLGRALIGVRVAQHQKAQRN